MIIKALAAVVAIVVVGITIVAFPTMLVLGALHSSTGLSAIPALGFLQTAGVLYLIAVVGQSLKGVPGTIEKK